MLESTIDITPEIRTAIINGYKDDYIFAPIYDYLQKVSNTNAQVVPISIKHYEYQDKLLYFGLYGQDTRNRLCILLDARLLNDTMTIRQALVHDYHDPSATGGHLGVEKTLEKLTMLYYWPNMTQYVKKYVVTCDNCQRVKPLQITQGLLQPLPIPSKKWQQISMDFIRLLPPSDSFNCILVIID